MKIIPNYGFVLSTWGEGPRGYARIAYNYFLYFELDVEVLLFDYNVIPNSSIFVEKAFASYSFAIALIYELFLEIKVSKKRIVVLFFALVSTQSTTAVFIILFVAFLYFNGHHGKSPIFNIAYILAIPFIIYYIVDISSFVLESKASSGHSFISRLSDFENGLYAWLENPILGYGYGNDEIIANFGTGYSNSIMQILMTGGIMLGSLYVVSFSRYLNRAIKRRDMGMFCFFLSFFVFFSTTGIALRNMIVYIVIMMFFGYKQSDIKGKLLSNR